MPFVDRNQHAFQLWLKSEHDANCTWTRAEQHANIFASVKLSSMNIIIWSFFPLVAKNVLNLLRIPQVQASRSAALSWRGLLPNFFFDSTNPCQIWSAVVELHHSKRVENIIFSSKIENLLIPTNSRYNAQAPELQTACTTHGQTQGLRKFHGWWTSSKTVWESFFCLMDIKTKRYQGNHSLSIFYLSCT